MGQAICHLPLVSEVRFRFLAYTRVICGERSVAGTGCFNALYVFRVIITPAMLHISSFLHSFFHSFIDQRLTAELTASLKTHLEELFSKLRRSSDVIKCQYYINDSFTCKFDLNLRNKPVKCYVWNVAVYSAVSWTLRKVDRNILEILKFVKKVEDQLDVSCKQ